LGKSDFEAIEAFRQDPYFAEALNIDQVPSAVTLHQRLDTQAAAFIAPIIEASIAFLQRIAAPITPLANGLVSPDADVTPLNNAKTKKKGVSRAYKGDDGLAPMAAYLGQEGYCLEWELRAGSQHCRKNTPALLQRVPARARRLTALPLLRLDRGNDALDNIATVMAHNEAYPEAAPVHYLVKWNPHQKSPTQWLTYAEEHGDWRMPRPGKRVALFEVRETRFLDGYEYRLRRVMRVIARTIDTHGQHLLIPDIEIEGWWTRLVGYGCKIVPVVRRS